MTQVNGPFEFQRFVQLASGKCSFCAGQVVAHNLTCNCMEIRIYEAPAMVDYTRLLEEAGVTFNLPAGIGTIVEISGCTNHAYKLLHLRDLLRDNQDVLTPEILEKTKAYVKVWDAL